MEAGKSEVRLNIFETPLFFKQNPQAPLQACFEFIKQRRTEWAKNGSKKRVIFACKTKTSQDGFLKILREYDTNLAVISITTPEDIKVISKNGIGIGLFELENGFEDDEYLFISETAILGRRIAEVKAGYKKDIHRAINEATKIKIGEIVVHKEYGIAVFEGLKLVEFGGKKYDMIALRYRNKEEVLIPVDRIGMVKKYGGDGHYTAEQIENIIDKLGSESFERRKKKVRADVKILAEKLLKTAAKRLLLEAEPFEKTATVEDFYNRFPYAPTPDQIQAITDIEADLSSGKPMDRVVCGDVGFGKTEVAMRASMLVCSQKDAQVAIVVPTTLLAHQHYKNFTERFKGTEIRICEYSRNCTAKELDNIKMGAKDGLVDIVIGTHGLFKSISFQNLKLLIIDEEQHFGVAQKEALKQGREALHTLALSATPIPRTLHMALSGIRDISVIATPPVDRLVVKTFVMEYDDIVLRNAILREKARAGRVFFVCPKIADLDEREEYLKKITPEARVCIAHGQMKGEKMDKIMIDFFEGKYDVLLTTSIIESGIDISFANTIIIHNSNLFGLSALYQLRGRVGRSGTQAYAYFMVARQDRLNPTAYRRLRTIANIQSLGAGFNVATSDMDIRGAGTLVGDEQSGQQKDVGVELYQDMVRDMMNKVRVEGIRALNEQADEDWVPEIKTDQSVMIPEDYIADFNTRIEFYKKISNCTDAGEFDALVIEMEDRFGKTPPEVTNLIHIIELKNLCKKYGISKLECGSKGMVLKFHKSFTGGQGLLAKVQASKGLYKIRDDGSLFIDFANKKPDLTKILMNLLDKY
jgi:transcription-repair coupling factor (superfamily II helicase)